MILKFFFTNLILKNVDEKIKDLGFVKTYEEKTVLQYERENNQFNYIHGVDLLKKTKNKPIIQS
jgi:hypothetical protein